MRITYILDRPDLCGGVKVVFQHAQILHRSGHEVTILGKGPPPGWIRFDVNYQDHSRGWPPLRIQDLVVATFWTTLAMAESMELGPIIHFCQGYEGQFPHLEAQWAHIRDAYGRVYPTWVTSPHLGELLSKRYGRKYKVISPPLDTLFRPAFRLSPRRIPLIALQGVFECDWKGVRTGLLTVKRLRESGMACRLLRISLTPLSPQERAMLPPDHYLCGIMPQVLARRLRACDLALFPSWEAEGFGLPLLEAMASKVPVVASRISSARFIGGEDEELQLVNANDEGAFADAARRLLTKPRLWRRARTRGFRAAQKFHPRHVQRQLEEAIQWAVQRC